MENMLLDGIRVLDLTDEKGFLCGNILGDLGADVIKIEKPGGDPSRNIPPYFHDNIDSQKSLYWFSYNANKRGITLNIESKKGQELFKRLVVKTDIVIESFPQGYMIDIGLGYNELNRLNKGIIVTSITPFGQSGPYSKYKGSDLVVQAMGVMLFQTGYPDRAPLRTTLPQAYMHAGADAAEGTMMAHYYKSLTGFGQHVDVSLTDSILGVAARALSYWDCMGVEIPRTAGEFRSPGGRFNPITWETKDGFISFVMQDGPGGAKNNKILTDWMETEQMAPEFMKQANWNEWYFQKASTSEQSAFKDAISRFFKAHNSIDLEVEAIKRNLTLTKICTSKDTVNNIQLAAREFWINLKHEELNETIKYPGAFAIFSETPLRISRRAPLIGEHNHDIYINELGLTEGEFGNLKIDEII